MKKIILLVVIIGAAIVGINNNTKDEVLSDVLLANVEALADDDEIDDSIDCCNNRELCKGEFCGTFYPANGTGVGISMYYK